MLLIAVVAGAWFAVADNSSSDTTVAGAETPAQAQQPSRQPPPNVSTPQTAVSVVPAPQAGASAASTPEAAVPVAPTPQPVVPVPPRGDLQLATPMSVPRCDGTGIAVLYSATNPATYAQEIASQLASNAGSLYLRTDNACASLRQQTADGNAIYAVYRVAGSTEQSVCAAVGAAGGASYGKWLDSTTDPNYIIPC